MNEYNVFVPKCVWTWERVDPKVWRHELNLKNKVKYLFWGLIGRPRWVAWYPYGNRYIGGKSAGRPTLVKSPHAIDESLQRNTKRGITKFICTHADNWRKKLSIN